MFRRIDGRLPVGRFTFEDREIDFCEGDSVAAALLAAGIVGFRDSPLDGGPRAPYCMMGVCFECLVEIDGVANMQACLTAARNGMTVGRQRGARSLR
jgi:hypothetical protein